MWNRRSTDFRFPPAIPLIIHVPAWQTEVSAMQDNLVPAILTLVLLSLRVWIAYKRVSKQCVIDENNAIKW